jgi:hypothetical protein
MGWYANHKARRAAAKAGPPTRLKTGLADNVEAEKVERAREREDRMEARAIAEDKYDALKGAKKARKRERKLARRGTAGPS